jgi:hypothetical protein
MRIDEQMLTAVWKAVRCVASNRFVSQTSEYAPTPVSRA